jgi:hypothetical protein
VRRHRLHRLQQQVRIAVDGGHAEFAEQLGTQPQHGLAVLQHVADARRGARIIFEHEEIIRAGADEIDAADVRPNSMWRSHAGDLGPELRIAEYQILREDAFLQNASLAVDIVQKRVDRLDPLYETLRQACPFVMQEYARNDVERNDPLGSLVLAVHGKRDAQLSKRGFGGGLPATQLRVRRVLDPAAQGRKFGTSGGVARCPHDFVERLFVHRNG